MVSFVSPKNALESKWRKYFLIIINSTQQHYHWIRFLYINDWNSFSSSSSIPLSYKLPNNHIITEMNWMSRTTSEIRARVCCLYVISVFCIPLKIAVHNTIKIDFIFTLFPYSVSNLWCINLSAALSQININWITDLKFVVFSFVSSNIFFFSTLSQFNCCYYHYFVSLFNSFCCLFLFFDLNANRIDSETFLR